MATNFISVHHNCSWESKLVTVSHLPPPGLRFYMCCTAMLCDTMPYLKSNGENGHRDVQLLASVSKTVVDHQENFKSGQPWSCLIIERHCAL